MSLDENEKSVSKNEDIILIEKIKQGDEEAFSALILKHREKIKNLIYVTLGDSADIDDIMQEVFISTYKYINGFRGDSAFSTWLYRITINKCKDHIKKFKYKNKQLPLEEAINLTASEKGYEYINRKDIVRIVIKKLPENLRIPLILRDVEGLSYNEIAEKLNLELSAVKSRIYRARETLKILLAPYFEELKF